ncbi:MAG: hypothetical protein H0V62_15480 [Gammaproteobacteria bacterium]|nr:hypothetical protein [Gammaproteobacteria bacterium]MBA3732351.1 hypothetical protein [Gammaproteobacteria bacterium]
MTTEIWIVIALAVLFVLALLRFIVLQERKAKKYGEKMDRSKLREWKDDNW